jgi:hypothetical protein
MRLYYLVNSLELNSIFTTESISSKFVIENRNFSPVNCQNDIFEENENIILLFENIPTHPNVGNSDVFAFKTIFELELNEAELIPIEKGAWYTENTIYLTPKILKQVFVYDDYHVKEKVGIGREEAIFNFERNKYTKTHDRYIHLFKSANILKKKDVDYFIRNSAVEINNNNLKKVIQADSIINFYIGALYCSLIGDLGNKSAEEIEILRNLEDIKNKFAIIQNRTNQKGYSKVNKKYVSEPYDKESEYKNLIKKNIKTYSKYFNINAKINHSKYEEDFLKSFPLGNDDVMKFDSDKKVILTKQGCIAILKRFISSGYSKIYKNQLEDYAKERLLEEDTFQFCLSKYNDLLEFPQLYFSKYSQEDKVDISDEFNKIHRNIEVLTKEQFLTKDIANKSSKNIEVIKFDSNTFSVSLGDTFSLNNKDSKLFSIICNQLLSHRLSVSKLSPKIGVEYFNENKKILEDIGQKAELEKGTEFRKSYEELYKYIVGKTTTYNIKSWNAFSVQQNFAAFLFKPININELQEYLESKKVNNKWIAYIFWGLFNGFSKIDKTFMKPLFVEGFDSQEIKEIDMIVQSLYSQLLKSDFSVLSDSVKVDNSKKHFIGEIVELDINHHLPSNDIESTYKKVKSKFEKIINNCLSHPNKVVKNFFTEKKRDNLFMVIEREKDNINPHFIESTLNDILKEASISKRSKAYKEIINYHLSDLIEEITKKL